MTKSEQTVYDTIKASNDVGARCYRPVANTKGPKVSWRRGGGYASGSPNKGQTLALERLLARGDVLQPLGGGYVVKGHPVLAELARKIDLEGLAAALAEAQRRYDEALAFVQTHTTTEPAPK